MSNLTKCKMFEELQFKFTFEIITALLFALEITESTYEFSSNARTCGDEIGNPHSSVSLLLCTNFQEFQICVDSRFRCNFVSDCPVDKRKNTPASDESGCAEVFCDFEANTTCGWNLTTSGPNNITRGWHWSLTQAGQSIGPSKDNTHKRIGAGHFLVANMMEGHPNAKASFRTPIIGSTEGNCTMEYYSYIMSGTSGMLQVLQTSMRNPQNTGQDLTTKVLEMVLPNNNTDKWIRRSVSWPKNSFYSISFVVTIPEGSHALRGAIAIDDIGFSNCTSLNTNVSHMEDPFWSGCPPDMFNCLESNAAASNCKLPLVICDTILDCKNGFDETSCSCDDYPSNFCSLEEICVIHNETSRPTCKCAHGGTNCNKDKESTTLLELAITIIIAVAGLIFIVFILTFTFYKLWQRRRARESFTSAYDVAFILDNTEMEGTSRPSSSGITGSNFSDNNYLTLENYTWGFTD